MLLLGWGAGGEVGEGVGMGRCCENGDDVEREGKLLTWGMCLVGNGIAFEKSKHHWTVATCLEPLQMSWLCCCFAVSTLLCVVVHSAWKRKMHTVLLRSSYIVQCTNS